MVTVRMILLANVDGQVKSQGHEVRGMAVVLDNDNVDREGLASPVHRLSELRKTWLQIDSDLAVNVR